VADTVAPQTVSGAACFVVPAKRAGFDFNSLVAVPFRLSLLSLCEFCLAPDFLDSELSVFMRRLRVQGVAGALGRE
jgi:hypothetical protein